VALAGASGLDGGAGSGHHQRARLSDGQTGGSPDEKRHPLIVVSGTSSATGGAMPASASVRTTVFAVSGGEEKDALAPRRRGTIRRTIGVAHAELYGRP
jgi:hypothetical protein